jgi:serine/threonine-protein kinase
VVLWEALTGRRLFEAENDYALMELVKAGHVDPPSRYAILAPGLDGIVLQGLSRDPGARFTTARDMAAAIERCVGLATPLEVAGWVEAIAGEAIRARSRVISQIERGEAAPTPQEAETASVLVPPLPSPSLPVGYVGGYAQSATTSVEGISDPETGDAPTRSIRDDDAPTRALDSVAMAARPAPALGWRHYAAAVAAAGTVVAGGAAIAFYSTRSAPGAVPSPASSTTEAAAAPAATTVEAPLRTGSPAGAPMPAATQPVTTASASPPEPAATSTASPEPSATARARAHAKTSCDPPYTVDDRGIRRIKRECVPR